MASDERADASPGGTRDLGVDGPLDPSPGGAHDTHPTAPTDTRSGRTPDRALGDAAVALTAELVAIDSVNPGLVPGAAGEAAVVDHLRTRLQHSGFATQVIPAPGGDHRPSLVAVRPTAPEAPTDPTVLLTGHLDTVGVEGMPAPFTPTVEGNRLSGRGSSDMKAGVAAMVVAAEELARRGAPGRVVLALVADEEDASTGAEAVLAALPGLGVLADVALVGEPTWLAMTRSLRGYALVEVTLAGRAAHSSQPDQGVNAVTHLGRLLAAVERHDATLAGRGASLMVTVASGGDSPFVLARSARALVERRSVPGERSAVALDEVEQLLAELRDADPTVEAVARLVIAREPWQLDPDGPAASLAAALEASLAESGPGSAVPERLDAPYWMEAPLWQAAGIPALVCGPAGGGLHAADEWVDLDQVRRYTVALTAAVERWSTEQSATEQWPTERAAGPDAD